MSLTELEFDAIGTALTSGNGCLEIILTLDPDDFTTPELSFIFRVMHDLHRQNEPLELMKIASELKNHCDSKTLDTCLNYLAKIPTQKEYYETRISTFESMVGSIKKNSKGLRVVNIREFLSLEFPPKEYILSPWLETQGLAMAYGIRGLGKTFFVMGVAVAVASGGVFLKWKSPKPYGVLHLDGEMPATTLQARYSKFIVSGDSEITAPLKIVTPDLQKSGMPDISTTEGQRKLESHLDGISLVIVDNISTLCRAGKENEAECWLPTQEWSLGLRTRGISVLFVHHAGKTGLQRGTSRKEDVLYTVINLKRPGDYKPNEGARVEVHFEKSRGVYGDGVKPFEAMLTTGIDGRQIWTVKDLEESTTDKIAKLLEEGLTQNEIAEELKISKGTVSKHKKKAINRKIF